MGAEITPRAKFSALIKSRGLIGMIPSDIVEHKSNCKNCAAPLTHNGCEYCGTGKVRIPKLTDGGSSLNDFDNSKPSFFHWILRRLFA